MRKPLPGQVAVRDFYNRVTIQVFVACLIGANFLTNIVEKEIDPKGTKFVDVFAGFNLFYNVAFTIELVVNLWGNWWWPFWKSGWNVFDAVVVTIGLVNMAELPLPPAFGMLRMMRAFRVFRLFKRVKALNKIIVAIAAAIPGVSNAFLILGIVMSIYAILAVELWTHMAEDCNSPNASEFDTRFRTPRGLCVGPEYFGTFSRSLYTFFQVLTGESWSEMVARPAIWYHYESALKAVGGSLFFVSYVLITGFMLINVVVAVLLDKMQDAAQPEEAADAVADADAGTNGVTDGNGEDQYANRASISSMSSVALKSPLATITAEVAGLVEDRQNMRNDLDAFTNDLTDLKLKMKTIMELVSTPKMDPSTI